jgi:hypothetical protein
MAKRLEATVYEPPLRGFPYLAVIVDPAWTVTAVKPFKTSKEARAYLDDTFKALKIKIKDAKSSP